MPTGWVKYPVDMTNASSYILPTYTYESGSNIYTWKNIIGNPLADFFAGTFRVTPNLTSTQWKIVNDGLDNAFLIYEYASDVTTTGNIPASNVYTGTKDFMIVFSSNHFKEGAIRVCYVEQSSVCDTIQLRRTIQY